MGIWVNASVWSNEQGNYYYTLTNITNRAFSSIDVDVYQSGGGAVYSAVQSLNGGDSFDYLITGLSANTSYNLQVWIDGVRQEYIPFTTGGGGGGSTPQPGSSSTDIGEQSTTVNWNTGSTLWAEEVHGGDCVKGFGNTDSDGYGYHGYNYPTVPNPTYRYIKNGFSFYLGWDNNANGGVWAFAATTSGVYCKSYTENDDNTVTYVFETRVRSRLYKNFPHHGLKVLLQDENGNDFHEYIEYKPSNSGNAYVNSISGSNTDAWFRVVTEGWSQQEVTVTYPRGNTATTKQAKIQVYHDINENINATDSGTTAWYPYNMYVDTTVLNLPIPQRAGYAIEVFSDENGSANASGGGSTGTSFVVQTGTSVTFNATPSEGYVFEGWYDFLSDTLVSSTNPYVVSVNSDMTLIAKFEEDTSDKASYLIEPITSQVYQLLDAEAVRLDSVSGSVTTGRVARFRTAPNKVWSGYELSTASSAPATVSNGAIYGINSEDYPNETSWTAGNTADYGAPDYIRAVMKVAYQSETSTTLTVRVYCSIQQKCTTLNASRNITWIYTEDGVDMTPYNGNPNLSSTDFKYTNYTSNVGGTSDSQDLGFSLWFKGNTRDQWWDLIDNVNNASASHPATSTSTPCNWYKDVVIQKGNVKRNFEVSTTIGAPRWSSETSTVTKTIVVPPIGESTACVGHNGSWKSGRVIVMHNDTLKEATMYVFDGTQWVKSHYY